MFTIIIITIPSYLQTVGDGAVGMYHILLLYNNNNIRNFKIHLGKTSLLMSYALDKFPEDYVPTVFDNNVSNSLV